ncbi:MOSC domain-containing protein [Quadrisphaera sp. INWT6]|uniref:MOSC domain-containing protein n=1 Tax=Quadrisphaera sp. INWT6 TaxID=2596917 RepID=UPI0019D4F6C0|nr:MOSC domain-containing protein [Quadrisphaera sp. INWT6]
MGTLLAVCRVHQLLPDPGVFGVTAIDKRPVGGPVRVRPFGVWGDVQADRADHGGRDKALYAYAQEAADRWAAELEREVPPGTFGENLRTSGVDVDGAEVGERWSVGADPATALVVEVTMPRTPCATFARRMREERWVRRFARSGRPAPTCAWCGPERSARATRWRCCRARGTASRWAGGWWSPRRRTPGRCCPARTTAGSTSPPSCASRPSSSPPADPGGAGWVSGRGDGARAAAAPRP